MGRDTAIPSGILCIAMASATVSPRVIFSSEDIKVAKPSGKLCIPMASAVKIPVLLRFDLIRTELWFSGFSSCSSTAVLGSWGFTSFGIILSISALSPIPAKKKKRAALSPSISLESRVVKEVL